MSRAPVEDVEITVVVAKTRAAVAAAGPLPVLAVVPDQNTWNDYGFKLYANLYVMTEPGEISDSLPIRMMFPGEDATADVLSAEIQQRGIVFPLSDIGRPFCTLQNEAKQYETLMQQLGFGGTIAGLRRLRDVVLAKLEGEDAEAIALSESEDFHVGMIREAWRYTALRRGGRFLRPGPVPVATDAAATFSVTATPAGFATSIHAEFDFEADAIFEDRACVLIGRNGVGKTQLLKAIVDGLTDAPGRADDAADVEISPAPKISRLLVFSSVPSDPYPKTIPPWFDVDYEYFAVAAEATPLGPRFIESVLDCLRDDGSAFGPEDSPVTRLELLESLLGERGMWTELNLPLRLDASADVFRRTTRIGDRLYVALDQGMSEKQLNQLGALVDRSVAAIILAPGGPRRLSSGEVAMVHFVAQAVASIENGSLLLLDEPETHLHPNYISVFMDLLQDALERTSSVAIIATHSAYVLREVPRRRVGVLQRNDGATFVDRPRMQTFGARIDDLSQFVFMDGDVSPRYRQRLAEWAREVGREMTVDDVLETYGDELSPVTMSLVARAMKGGENS